MMMRKVVLLTLMIVTGGVFTSAYVDPCDAGNGLKVAVTDVCADVNGVGRVGIQIDNSAIGPIRGVQLDVLFDTDMLYPYHLSRKTRTYRVSMEEFRYVNIPNGIRILIECAEDTLISGTEGSVAEISLTVSSETNAGEFSLIVANASIMDANGNQYYPAVVENGCIVVPCPDDEVSLSISDVCVGIETEEVTVPIVLDNNPIGRVSGVQLDLLFDTYMLDVVGISRTERTEHLEYFEYSKISGGIRIIIHYLLGDVLTGTKGPIIDVNFTVADSSAGEYILDVNNTVVCDIDAFNITHTLVDGKLSIPCEALLSVSGSSASQGGNAQVLVGLDNSSVGPVTTCQVDLYFDMAVFGFTGILKTDRTASIHNFAAVSVPGGISIIIDDTWGGEILGTRGPVANITFSVSDEASGEYELTIARSRVDGLTGSTDIPHQSVNGVIYIGNATGFISGNGHTSTIPESYDLFQNHPNPFNVTTDIRYQIPDGQSSAHTSLKIYNILGQEVRTLVDEYQDAGFYSITWDGRDNQGNSMPSGVYSYRLSVNGGEWSEVRKMVIVR